MPQAFLGTDAFPPDCRSPCGCVLVRSRQLGCSPGRSGCLRRQQALCWQGCEQRLDDCLADQGAGWFGRIRRRLDRNGGPTISRRSASLTPRSGESRIPLASPWPLPLGNGSLWLPFPSPLSPAALWVRGVIEVARGTWCDGRRGTGAGAAGPSWGQRRLLASVGLGVATSEPSELRKCQRYDFGQVTAFRKPQFPHW